MTQPSLDDQIETLRMLLRTTTLRDDPSSWAKKHLANLAATIATLEGERERLLREEEALERLARR